MATYQVTHKQLLDGYAVLQTLTPSEFEVGQSLTVAGITGFNGTFTIYALPQFAFIGIDSEGDLLFNYEIPIPNQVIYALSGTDVNRTAASGTITYAPTCTWIDANDIATWLYLTPATAGDLAFLTSCAAAANATCYRKRQEAGYAADSLTTPPSADVELATTILGGTLYRSRSSMDQIASYDGMGITATVGITSQIKILLGIPRAQVA
jgi:hypothetical protein